MNSSHFKPVELETTVIVESDDEENIYSPTETSSSSVGDSYDTEAERNPYNLIRTINQNMTYWTPWNINRLRSHVNISSIGQ